MCAAFEIKGKVARPGKPIQARSKEGFIEKHWAGFARNEILNWWLRKGAVELDIFAERFAERSDLSHQLIWAPMPRGLVIRGLLLPDPSQPLVKIVTRASTEEEMEFFQHPRMPLLEEPLFGPIPVQLPASENAQEQKESQSDLFPGLF